MFIHGKELADSINLFSRLTTLFTIPSNSQITPFQIPFTIPVAPSINFVKPSSNNCFQAVENRVAIQVIQPTILSFIFTPAAFQILNNVVKIVE
jgi:hypothetical protein